MAASDASQPAACPERRIAENGHPYTKTQFMHYYKSAGEFRWTEAEARGPPTDGSAAQPPAEDVIANQQHTNQQEDANQWISSAEVGRQPVDQQRHDLAMHQEVIEEVQEELTFSWIERNGCHYDEHWDIVFRGFEVQVPLPPWGYEWRPGDEQGDYVLRDKNDEMPWYYPWR